MNAIRERLRAETRDEHAALDALAGGWRLNTPEDYGLFLQASAAALAPLEQALEDAGVAAWGPDWSSRSRRAALSADLAALDLEPPPSEPAQVPDPAFGAGLLYVLEGSRLGARFLSRQVAENPDLPRAYLEHGEGQGLWRSYLDWLDGPANVAFPTDDLVAGARYGFRRFAVAFETWSAREGENGSVNVRTGSPAPVKTAQASRPDVRV